MGQKAGSTKVEDNVHDTHLELGLSLNQNRVEVTRGVGQEKQMGRPTRTYTRMGKTVSASVSNLSVRRLRKVTCSAHLPNLSLTCHILTYLSSLMLHLAQ